MGNTETESKTEGNDNEKEFHKITTWLDMSNENIDNNNDIDDKGLIKFIRSPEGKKSLNEFIPNDNDTLITIINKFIYFNFIYNKLIESGGKYNSWKAAGLKPAALERMKLVFFDNIRYSKTNDKHHMNKVIIPLFRQYYEFFTLCRNTILSFQILEDICKFTDQDKSKFKDMSEPAPLYIYTSCIEKFGELKKLWIDYVKNISKKIELNNNDTSKKNGNILYIFKYTINEFMTTFTKEKIKEYSLVKNILENVINNSINSDDLKNSKSKKLDKIMLKKMIENLKKVKQTFIENGIPEPGNDIWRDCYVKTFAQGPTRITLLLEDMCNAYKVKYLPDDEPRNRNNPLSQTDERWEIVEGKRQSLIKDKEFVDRVKVGETIKPCPGDNEASSVLFDFNGEDNVIKMNIYTMRFNIQTKKYEKYHCYKYFNFVPVKYNENKDDETKKNYEKMRERLTIDYQYTLMTKIVRDGIFIVNNSHFKGNILRGAATKLFLETRSPFSPFLHENITEDGEEKSIMVDYNVSGEGGSVLDNERTAPVTPPGTPRGTPVVSEAEEEEEVEGDESKGDLIPPGIPPVLGGDESTPPDQVEIRRKNMENLKALRDQVRAKQNAEAEAKLKAIEDGARRRQEEKEGKMDGGKRKKKTKKKRKTKKNKTKKRKRKRKKRKKK